MNEKRFTSSLVSTVEAKFGEIMAAKKAENRYLTYIDGTAMSAAVRNIFKNRIGSVPAQIDAACDMSLAVLAPSRAERIKLLKAAFGITGGIAGMSMILSGIGTALGWGASLVATTTAFFVGTPMAGPIGWIACGAGLAAIAGYFAFSGDHAKSTEKYLNCLKASLEQAMLPVWQEHGQALTTS
jgi:hypothetical protein